MYLGRIAFAEAVEDADGAEFGGNITCPMFRAKLMIFREFGSANPSTGTLVTIGEEVLVANTQESEIESGDQFVIGQGIDEVWMTINCCLTEDMPSSSSSSSSEDVVVI